LQGNKLFMAVQHSQLRRIGAVEVAAFKRNADRSATALPSRPVQVAAFTLERDENGRELLNTENPQPVSFVVF
jgi:hypothetical protein